VARAARIPHVVARPEDVIGEVDAVVIPTDKGHEHLDRARPFIEAGLPVFIDKPLVDREDHLRQFAAWVREGKPILSSSAMRYSVDYVALRKRLDEVGDVRFASITTPKTWERYGIHALEGIYPFFGPGFLSARNTGTIDRNIVHLKHACGADVVIAAHNDMYGAFGILEICGTKGVLTARPSDTFTTFKTQLETFVAFLKTGEPPFPFEETIELMKIIIAGIRSRKEDGREVALDEIHAESLHVWERWVSHSRKPKTP
jgi:predicted dehydrogenase